MWRQNENVYVYICILKNVYVPAGNPSENCRIPRNWYLQNHCDCLNNSVEGRAVTSVNCVRWECQYTQLTNYWPLVLSYFRQPVGLYRVAYKHMAPRLVRQSTEFQQVIMGLEGSNSGCQGLGYMSHMNRNLLWQGVLWNLLLLLPS